MLAYCCSSVAGCSTDLLLLYLYNSLNMCCCFDVQNLSTNYSVHSFVKVAFPFGYSAVISNFLFPGRLGPILRCHSFSVLYFRSSRFVNYLGECCLLLCTSRIPKRISISVSLCLLDIWRNLSLAMNKGNHLQHPELSLLKSLTAHAVTR